MRRYRAALLIAALTSTVAVTLAPSPAQATGRPTKDPVILIHGWNSDASAWATMTKRLRKAGYPEDLIFTFGYDYRRSNAVSAEELKDYVSKARRETGGKRVDLVAHSMGSLVSRYYLRYLDGTGKVDDWISLAGPNHGTRVAALCSGQPSCREMLPGSAFLSALNSGDETPGPVHYRTFFSECDNVVPYSSTPLTGGATNTKTGCLEHSALRTDAAVAKQVIAELSSRR